MTKTEAIKLLCVEKSIIVEVDGNKGAEKMLQAYDMAIEALSERTGEWIPHATSVGDKKYIEYSRCSECGEMALVRMNFCPNCGADMRGKNNET